MTDIVNQKLSEYIKIIENKLRHYTEDKIKNFDKNNINDKLTLSYVAEIAYKGETGARGLKSIMENTMIPFMFRVPDMDTGTKIVITKDEVEKSTKETISGMMAL